jgi:HEAT repeat protein
MDMLKNTSTEDDLDKISQALGPAIKQFTEKEGKSRGEQMAFLRGLVTDENFNKRLVAIRFLASQQDLDNVPALLYALTDPDFRICREAHNGLRLISRKVDAFTLTENASRAEFDAVRKSWTEWYLGIRPDAQLFEDDQ